MVTPTGERSLTVTMATFRVEEFCGSDFGRNELRKLRKEDLLAVAQYCEVEINPEARKPEIVETLISALHLHDPVQEREREERKSERRGADVST